MSRQQFWYEKRGFVIAALILFWPLGLTLMWAQRQFEPEARAAITVAAPLLTLLLVGALVTSPPAALQPGIERAGWVEDDMRAAIEGLGGPASELTTPSLPATSTVESSTLDSASPAPSTDSSAAGQLGVSGSGNAGPLPPPQDGPAQACFTLEGTYTETEYGPQVSYTLKALPYANIVSWTWWIVAGGSTQNKSGQTIVDSYSGQPPTSIRLTATASNGKTYQSEAGVDITNGRIYAAVR